MDKVRISVWVLVKGSVVVIALTIYINIVTFKKIKSALREDLSLLLSNSNQGPASALAPLSTLPYAAPVVNSDLVPPKMTTSRNSPPSPTSVLMDPLVGPWVPSTLIPAALLRDPLHPTLILWFCHVNLGYWAPILTLHALLTLLCRVSCLTF